MKRMSHIKAMSSPAPTATPFRAHSSGLSIAITALATLCTPCVSIRLRASGASSTDCSTDRSMPEQKAFPAPVSTTTRTPSSSVAARSASAQSSIMSSVKAFLRRGLSSVIVAMASATS